MKLTAKKKAIEIARLLGEKLGDDIVILEIKKLSSVADYVVICGGGSSRQIKTLSKGVQEGLLKEYKEKPLTIEGERVGQWVLMDYADVVVHIFIKSERERYDLEGLWVDVPRLEVQAEDGEGNASAPSK